MHAGNTACIPSPNLLAIVLCFINSTSSGWPSTGHRVHPFAQSLSYRIMLYKLNIIGVTLNGSPVTRCVASCAAEADSVDMSPAEYQYFLDGFDPCSYFDDAWTDGTPKSAFDLRFDDPRTAEISIGNLYQGDDIGGFGYAWDIVEDTTSSLTSDTSELPQSGIQLTD